MRKISIVKHYAGGMIITIGNQSQCLAFWPTKGDTGLKTESLISVRERYPQCYTNWAGGLGVRLAAKLDSMLADIVRREVAQ